MGSWHISSSSCPGVHKPEASPASKSRVDGEGDDMPPVSVHDRSFVGVDSPIIAILPLPY
jgi:hypothetical protein|tara:strand:- start:557 stop:736 length:180 start_codon:yes stop_codon:yes gene_type:complete